MKARDFWINQGFFQLAWPACVFGAVFETNWPGIVLLAAFAAWQLHPERRHREDVRTLLIFVACGVVLDSLWQQLGIVRYAHAWPVPGLAPLWLLCLWAAMSLTVHHSLAVFKRRWAFFAAVAAVGSPLSYLAAGRFGAVEWLAPEWMVILCVGPIWGLIVALLFRQAGRMSGGAEDGLIPDGARG